MFPVRVGLIVVHLSPEVKAAAVEEFRYCAQVKVTTTQRRNKQVLYQGHYNKDRFKKMNKKYNERIFSSCISGYSPSFFKSFILVFKTYTQ